ncbi:MAG: hypothetical protein GY869_10660, partial [Planctomycetes bacterium]|nr:hypothetical protein [Planctomycetota bacterium]
MRKEAKKFVWFFVLMVGILALPLVVSGQTMVWYVDDDAGGAHNGTSWADAFTNLQDALAVAYYGDEIRVGQGSYTPDTGSGYSLGYRGASFGLKSGVTIYGGYAGVGADYPNDRIVDLYKTILSGDLNDDDNRELFESDTLGILAGIGEEFWSSGLGLQHDLDNDGEVDFDDVIFLLNAYNYDDNSIHVVTASWEVSGAILDGLYICGGSTHGSFDASGGGVYNYGEITMNDCVLSHNLCYYYPGLDATQGGGGGMVSLGSEAELSECTFSLNVSWGGGGGGMYNSTDYCDLIDCDFNDNRAMKVQGDAQMYYGGNGGGLYNIGDNLTLMEGLIVDNRAGVHGGGMYNTGENLAGEDSVFRCNSAEEKGGGGYNSADNFTTTSCYFYLNSALEGDGLYNWSDNFSMSAGTIDALAGYVGLSSDINLGLEESLVVRDQLTIGGDTAITGGGEIVVEFGGELRLESMATVDLSWGKGGKGLIQCDGFLEATDYTNIQYVRLNVSCSNFNYSASISNSIITTQGDLPYGQFEIQDGASVILNEIHSAGDHYLDLNPPNYYGLLELNEIYVTVSEGAGGVEGDMLEVRGVDGLLNSYIPDPNNPYLGRAPAGTTPDFFTDSWTLEELRIEDNAKVTLVNRFDYQYPYDTGGAEEVVYVKNLILGENAVLNTSFNRIYYENLVIAPTAVVPNRALTALSLGTIDFNSD